MVFSDRLKKVRLEANLSQAELAEKLNLNVRTYGSYERGERDVSTSLLLNICQVLGVSSDYLLGNNETTPAPIETEHDDATLKFALFGDTDVDDEVLDDVKRYARIARQMREEKKKE